MKIINADYAGAKEFMYVPFLMIVVNYPEEGENLIIKNCNFTNNFAQVALGLLVFMEIILKLLDVILCLIKSN